MPKSYHERPTAWRPAPHRRGCVRAHEVHDATPPAREREVFLFGTQSASTPGMNLQISFHDLEPSPAVDAYVREHAAKLETFFDRIVNCRVAVESPHRHKRHGRHFRVRIDAFVPGQELVVDRTPAEHANDEDLYAAVDDAFGRMQRVLRDYAQKKRGDVKSHGPPTRG